MKQIFVSDSVADFIDLWIKIHNLDANRPEKGLNLNDNVIQELIEYYEENEGDLI